MPCAGVCARVASLEPQLPLSPVWSPSPFWATDGHTVSLPWAFLLGGWHCGLESLAERLHSLGQIDLRNACFYDWKSTEAAAAWVRFRPPRPNATLAALCVHSFQFYPAFAGRYHSAWAAAYGPCKAEQLAHAAKGQPGYYDREGAMWKVCRPLALSAHDAAVGTGGVGQEATPPFALAALFGAGGVTRARIVVVLRNPSERYEISFWIHKHYQSRYGSNAEGLHRFAEEQTQAFTRCVGKYGPRRCAFLFEMLDPDNAGVFFHCDQVIRGIYAPFMAEWLAAFPPASVRVVRAEDFLDDHNKTVIAVARFIGLPGVVGESASSSKGGEISVREGADPPHHGDSTIRSTVTGGAGSSHSTYAALHAKEIEAAGGKTPMAARTRLLLDAFYEPYNQQLATLLRDHRFLWQTSPNGIM